MRIFYLKKNRALSGNTLNRIKRFSILGIIVFLAFITIKSTPIIKEVDNATMQSQFTPASITIDGIMENEWKTATPQRIGIAMTPDLTASATNCNTYGEVRSLWNGAKLYLLINVADTGVTAAGRRPTDKDGVEIYLDLWNDKFPKYEEDDGMMRISSEGELSGSGVYADRLKAYATRPVFNRENIKTGYVVELAINIGGVEMKNGSAIGIDFGINDATTSSNTIKNRVFWSDGNNNGINDNTRWGTMVLRGYDGKMTKAIDSFLLRSNIKKAETISRGIWINESQLNQALTKAKAALSATTQNVIDAANNSLDKALNELRRKGKYPDPLDLKPVNYLPDPFTFLNGKKVKSVNDWTTRREEILDLAQYYEYGYMPKAPDEVTATVNGNAATVTVKDKGKTASFNTVLTVPTEAQCGKPGPYPVIVSIEFGAAKANELYLNAGYAVLGIVYSSVASDNNQHNGAFYALYPYDVTMGNDAGTLLAWAWGASRGVDALHYLSKNNPDFSNAFDLKKLVVTGFSRCGKAALAAGLFDKRFAVVSPAASGCGGAAVYRYTSFGNTPGRKAPFGNVYAWGSSPGCEVLGDKVRHQGHNSNEMLARFLNGSRIYKTKTLGYGERLPYDHHQLIATIAPRAVLVTTANDDYANNAEGDCIGLEAAKPVYNFLGAGENIALNIRTSLAPNPRFGGAHYLDDNQVKNLVLFSDKIFFGTPLKDDVKTKLYLNPYLATIDNYYGGLSKIMPWRNSLRFVP